MKDNHLKRKKLCADDTGSNAFPWGKKINSVKIADGFV